MSISAFTKEISKTMGVPPIDITVDSKTSISTLFVIFSTANYNALLGRDWIHANWCVSSSFHQFLQFWKGGEVEVVWKDQQPFIETSYSVDANYYDQDFGPIKFKGNNKNGAPREIYMESGDTGEIQDQAAKILKTTSIMHFRLIKGLIIEDIDY